MKKTLIAIAFLCSFLLINAQQISGLWKGSVAYQNKTIGIELKIYKEGKTYGSYMNIPETGSYELPTAYTRVSDSCLQVKLQNEDILYTAHADGKGRMSGVLSQSGVNFPLIMKCDELADKPVFGEENAPFCYQNKSSCSYAVNFRNRKSDISLSGTLSLPIQKTKYPIVILISSGGKHNRDEEQYGHKPFEVMAAYLNRNGIAVLRFDDRGTAQSEGNFDTATTFDLASDVEAAVDFLKNSKDLNISSIGLIGHSEGGIIASMVASKDHDIHFVVTLAAPAVNGESLLLSQLSNTGAICGAGTMFGNNSLTLSKEELKIVCGSESQQQAREDLTSYFNRTTTANYSQQQIREHIESLTSAWMMTFVKIDPTDFLKATTCPVLALFGSSDRYVDAAVNASVTTTVLRQQATPGNKVKVLNHLNHNFQHCNSGLICEYSTIDQPISPVALESIAGWILKQK